MKVGLTAVGSYIPRYRLKRNLIGTAWERNFLKGEKSVANADEDSLSMAVEAARNCLRLDDAERVDSVFFASLTPPYAEKSHSSLLAVACGLKQSVFTADFGHSPKAGTSALRAAIDAVLAGSAERALVSAAECPVAYPKSDQEQMAGDAAASVLVGKESLIAELKGFYSVNNEILDLWRNTGERFAHNAEGRFASSKGYGTAVAAAIQGLLKQANIKAKDVSSIVLAAPDFTSSRSVIKQFGFTPEQVADPLLMQIGYCASAQPLLQLAAVLEKSEPGDLILLASYGTGSDAFLFQATDTVASCREGATVASLLASGRQLGSYSRYLSFRGLIETVPGEPFRTFPSTAAYWRDAKSLLSLFGSKCKDCGTTATPIQRVCPGCGSVDRFVEVPLSGRKAKVFTYSIDNMAGRSDDPTVVQTVCEDADGTRYYMLMTDFDKEEVAIGMEVEFTFRNVYAGGNYNNYYWKCRPVRLGGK